jgi:hypothetical protein
VRNYYQHYYYRLQNTRQKKKKKKKKKKTKALGPVAGGLGCATRTCTGDDYSKFPIFPLVDADSIA